MGYARVEITTTPDGKTKTVVRGIGDETGKVETGGDKTDPAKTQNFLAGQPVKKIHLYGLLARRSVGTRRFEELLRKEAQDVGNLHTKFFGFIKMAWLPVLAVLEHGDDALKAELANWLRTWPNGERQLLLDYLAKEKEALAWLDLHIEPGTNQINKPHERLHMISPQEAIAIVQADIQRRGEAIDSICSPEEVRLELAAPLRNRQGVDDIYVVRYAIPWGLELATIFVDLSAYTGEIYDRIGPAPYRA